jgi:hypothetical protein
MREAWLSRWDMVPSAPKFSGVAIPERADCGDAVIADPQHLGGERISRASEFTLNDSAEQPEQATEA